MFALGKDFYENLKQVQSHRKASGEIQRKINEMHEKLIDSENPISEEDYQKLREMYSNAVELSTKEERLDFKYIQF